MNGRDTQHDPGHSSALKEIAEARVQAGQELATISTDSIDPNSVTYGANSPAARAQAFTFYYLDQVAPYRSRIPELWNDRSLGTVHVPRERSKEAPGNTSATIKRRRIGPPDEQTTIEGLKEFTKWRHATAKFKGHSGGRRSMGGGESVERIVLPVAVLHRAYEALNDAVAQLNLAADVPEPGLQGDTA